MTIDYEAVIKQLPERIENVVRVHCVKMPAQAEALQELARTQAGNNPQFHKDADALVKVVYENAENVKRMVGEDDDVMSDKPTLKAYFTYAKEIKKGLGGEL